MRLDKIALCGLGKLGLPLGLVFAQEIDVIGVDVDVNKLDVLKSGNLPFYEPQLPELLNTASMEFSHMDDLDIEDVDTAIILVNTPSQADGSFSNSYVFSVVRALSRKLKKSNKEDFLFILSSTVMPETHRLIIQEIESITGRKLNEGFGLVYIPDLVALGSVVHDFKNPDLLIVGESNPYYGTIAINLYKKILHGVMPINRMSLLEAEVAKVSLNAYITMKLSFANFIGNLGDVMGFDPNRVMKALGSDRRISPYYARSGLPFGGTCFPRDTWAFIKMADMMNMDACHIKATQKINQDQHQLLYDKVLPHKDKKIGIIGLSFKPDTAVVEESATFMLYERLIREGFNVAAYDPLCGHSVILPDLVKNSDVILLGHNKLSLYENLDFSGKILINPWNLDV